MSAVARTQEQLEVWPYNTSRWNVFLKTLLGLILWLFISFLVFMLLLLVWGTVESAVSASIWWTWWWPNALLSLILVVIAFVGTFIWSLILASIYNLLFTTKYYDMGKMIGLVLFANILVFIAFLPMYIIFSGSGTFNALYFVLAFHITFSVFISFTLIEVSTNPNYSAVHLIGATIGLVISLVIFAWIFKSFSTGSDVSNPQLMLSLPAVLIYTSLPFWHGVWEKIYYKFYEMGSDFFYIPSLSEVLVDANDVDEVEVDIDM